MSTLEKLSELEARKMTIQNQQLTARARISNLLDENSFVEIGAFIQNRSTKFNMNAKDVPADGVVCGYGTVNGSLVYVFSQDATALGGAVGEMHAKKIVRTYEEAVKVGAPIVGFIDTKGLRLQEQLDGLEGYGMMYQAAARASGIIPQIAVICGDCGGGASFMAGLADFVCILEDKGQLFLNSPNTFEEAEASFDTVAKASVHLEMSGMAHFGSSDEEELINSVKQLLSYLPANCDEEVPFYEVNDDLNRVEPALNAFDFETGDKYDILTAIVDNKEHLEVSKRYGTDVYTGFARMNGATVGFVMNKESVLGYEGIKKITEFITLCDTYHIPVVTLTDIERFESTVATEQKGIIKEVSRMIQAFALSGVAKVNVLLRHGYGSSYIAMNSRPLGADYVYAWPTAHVATMNSESAVRIIYEEELKNAEIPGEMLTQKIETFENEVSSVYAAAQCGQVDDIIEPAATRKRIIAALEMLYGKQAW